MTSKKLELFVYGAEQVCASCVNLPSSKETASWLESALGRRYGNESIVIRYIDIFSPEGKDEIAFSERVIEEDLWYPVLVIENDVITEGNPNLKVVFDKLEERGLQPLEN